MPLQDHLGDELGHSEGMYDLNDVDLRDKSVLCILVSLKLQESLFVSR